MKIKTNPDADFAREIKKDLKKNNGYCPNAMTKNKDTKCMCKEFREQNEKGYCRCGLYYKE